MADEIGVFYWDASAVLSALFDDIHSNQSKIWAEEKGVHLLSTLAYAETYAVITRIMREGTLAPLMIEAVLDVLRRGPWRRLKAWPEWDLIEILSAKWPLRGADLWHLATAKSLQEELPELILLTFDTRLLKAAEGEGLGQEKDA